MKTNRMGNGILAALVLLATAVPVVGAADAKVNLNKASVEDLKKLPEMNEARAKAIVNHRGSTGEFIQIEELELIPQVKPIYSKLKDLVVVE